AVYVAFDLQRGTDVEHSPPEPGKRIGVRPEPDSTRKDRRSHDDSSKKATKTTPDTPPSDSRKKVPTTALASSNDQPPRVGNRGPAVASTPSPPSPPGQNDLPPTFNARAPLVDLLNTPEKKVSVPSAAELTSARRTAEEKFQQDLQTAKTPEQRLNVARKIQRAALDAKLGSAERYALLDQARELAAGAGSSKVAFEAIDGLAKWFEIEELELRLETLEVAAKAPNSPKGKAAKKEQFESAKDMIETCVAIDRFPEALRATALAQAAARNLRDQEPGLVKQVVEERKDLEKLAKAFAAIKDDLERLKADAGDAAANLAVGRFYCLAKKDWARGLSHLVAGDDATLKDLAQRELAKPSGAEDEKSLGDDWWELSRKERGPAKTALASRACFWYRRSLTFLSGVEKEAVEQKLEEAGETGRTDTTQFLSELPETNVVVDNNWFGKGRNAAVNKPIHVAGKESPHGLYTVPTKNGNASVSYELGKKAKRLNLDVAIDDGEGANPRTALVFQVWGDGVLLQTLGPVAVKGQVFGCELKVSTVKILELRVICAGSNNFAHAVWLEPRVTWK
ncbi:MAG TPA: NPCBM/NEW2 domain-containing protein, partial [Pirellulales bacterium]|nr:NPCBM/NEW2 domain-containing protein [Pirellulales bacterium]